jgi:hypothetical protein
MYDSTRFMLFCAKITSHGWYGLLGKCWAYPGTD